MKTPKIQLVLQAVSAAALALTGSFYAVPALADGEPEPGTTASAPPAAPTAPAPSDAGLSRAVLRDLGMTLAEFNAAGDQARRAADAVPTLRALPGYAGIRLTGGKVIVEGTGSALQSRVDELNETGPADFVLAAPAADPAASPAPSQAAPPQAPGPAPADPTTPATTAAELVASSTEQLFQAYVRDVGTAGLQAVAHADGRFVIRTGGANTAEAGPSAADTLAGGPGPQTEPAATAPGKVSPADFVARYANVALEQGSPIATEEDLFGGQGYVTTTNSICSTGFGGFKPDGQPVVLTAGHCADDGRATTASIEPLKSAPASGRATPSAPPYDALGAFGFSQFGGPENSWITGNEANPGNVGTDIAVLESLRKGLAVQPAATVWASGAASPGATAVKIIGAVAPVQGQLVCRSGRTTGWSCGTVQELGIYVVAGTTTDPADLRAFRGFLSKDVQSSGGDSGGPWISGNFAVGTHSAGDGVGATENFAIAATLEDSLARIPGGVQLQLFLNKPELTAAPGQTVTAGQPVTGRIPAAPASAVAANSRVRVSFDNGAAAPVEVPVDAAGNWAFAAPSASGPLRFSAEAVNGFSRSGQESFSLQVSDLSAPAITNPLEGAAVQVADRIDGTGTPGLTVELSGDATGRGTVAPDGRWSIALTGNPVYGQRSVTAVQTSPQHVDSPPVSRNFTLTPAAPAVSAMPDGVQFGQGSLPRAITGTGLDGALVTVTIDGAPAGTATAAGGRWSVAFPAHLAAGSHALSVTQSVDGVTSPPLTATFTVTAPAPVAPTADGSAPPAPVQPAGTAVTPGQLNSGQQSPGQLADTGANALPLTAGLAAGSLLLGGALLALGRRYGTKTPAQA